MIAHRVCVYGAPLHIMDLVNSSHKDVGWKYNGAKAVCVCFGVDASVEDLLAHSMCYSNVQVKHQMVTAYEITVTYKHGEHIISQDAQPINGLSDPSAAKLLSKIVPTGMPPELFGNLRKPLVSTERLLMTRRNIMVVPDENAYVFTNCHGHTWMRIQGLDRIIEFEAEDNDPNERGEPRATLQVVCDGECTGGKGNRWWEYITYQGECALANMGLYDKWDVCDIEGAFETMGDYGEYVWVIPQSYCTGDESQPLDLVGKLVYKGVVLNIPIEKKK